VTGAFLEIGGADGNQKADKLAAKLKRLFKNTEVKIARPTKKVEIKNKGPG